MQELARVHTPDAIQALVDALASPRERVSAAVALLDRGWGRPMQAIGGDSNAPMHYIFSWADSPPPTAPLVADDSVVVEAEAIVASDAMDSEIEIVWAREAAD